MHAKHFHAALHAPVAPYTREARVVLEDDQRESERVTFDWAKPVRIVGFHASVEVTGEQELATPTLDTILVLVDTHSEERVYTRRAAVPGANAQFQQYVTLSSIVYASGRLVDMVIESDAPQLGVRFAGRRGADVYNTCEVAFAVWWDYLDRKLSEN